MCGLAGFARWRQDSDTLAATAAEMAQAIYHRGPDDHGIWTDPAHGLALAFRRLSIIDLSPAGHQPMRSHSGRHMLAFNGEIYNAPELKLRLDGIPWHGHSDTEVLLEALERWGVERTLAEADGMFALALLDTQTGTLTLARDRFGEKPLYWGWCNGVFLFGSEVKALRRHPAFDTTLDPSAIAQYLRWNWFPAPSTPFAAIRALPPGHVLTLDAHAGPGAEIVVPHWQARLTAATQTTFEGSFAEAQDAVHAALSRSVERRLRADVPLALFLSGGVDSTLLAVLASQLHPDLKSYGIAFDDAYHDESAYAKQAAQVLGLHHREMRMTEADALSMVPSLPGLLDLPLGDSAAIPLALISRLAAQQVRVVLSGDGADELFGGYGTHRAVAADWQSISGIPGRRVLSGLLSAIPPEPLDRWGRTAGDWLGRKRRSLPGHRLAKTAALLGAASPSVVAGIHRGLWRGLPPQVTGAQNRWPDAWNQPFQLADAASEAMLCDVMTYLPDDLCTKTDRATMAASLEARLPFLEPELAQLAWSLPLEYKIGTRPDGSVSTKHVLRALLLRHFPEDFVHRPKHGLEVPTGTWLRGALKDWAGDLLSPARLKAQGLIEPTAVALAWEDHQSRGKGWGNELWGLAMLQAWLD